MMFQTERVKQNLQKIRAEREKRAFQEFILGCSGSEGGSTTAWIMAFKFTRNLIALHPELAKKTWQILNTDDSYVTDAQIAALKALLSDF